MIHGHFTKGDLMRLMNRLAVDLHTRGVKADLYVYGGAAFLLGEQIARDETSDVDAFVDPGNFDLRSQINDIRKNIASAEGIRPTWLSVNTSANLDAMVARRRDYFSPALPDLKTKGLSVYLLKPEAQLAMKLVRDDRAKPQDKADVAKLEEKLGIRERGDLIEVWDRHKAVVDATADKKKKVDRTLRTNFWPLPQKAPA